MIDLVKFSRASSGRFDCSYVAGTHEALKMLLSDQTVFDCGPVVLQDSSPVDSNSAVEEATKESARSSGRGTSRNRGICTSSAHIAHSLRFIAVRACENEEVPPTVIR